jgi:glycosyltransferase involved in cell wall biosynthesis
MTNSQNLKILYLVNVDWFFISHRLPIALELIKRGFEVHIACKVTKHESFLISQGLIVHELEMPRSSTNPISFLNTFGKIYSVLKMIKPDILHLITIKPVLIGGIAARLCKVPSVVVAISGLGFIYVASGIFAKIRKLLISILYKISLKHPNIKIIFQNTSDLHEINQILPLSEHQHLIIPGSGINLEQYTNEILSSADKANPIVLMASRMLRDKGVIEFIRAARYVKNLKPNVRFVLAGMIDQDNPTGISEDFLMSHQEEGYIEYWGHQENMSKLLQSSSMVVLPSYREGMPKILLEAAAAGRAVITTDVPGCRDAIIENITGLLVQPKNYKLLADSIMYLLNNPSARTAMGLAGRKLAVEKFDIEDVISQHLLCYQELLS